MWLALALLSKPSGSQRAGINTIASDCPSADLDPKRTFADASHEYTIKYWLQPDKKLQKVKHLALATNILRDRPARQVADASQNMVEADKPRPKLGKLERIMMRSLFFMLSCLFLCNTGAARSLPIEEDDMALKRELKMLNKPYVKSFKDKYGGIFDCVDMHKQPAFDHPLLKNHKIQISSPSSSSSKNTTTRIGPMKAIEEEIRVSPQESCPDGTVLLRRTLKQDLVKASASLPRFRQVKDKDHSEIPGQHNPPSKLPVQWLK
ncbi:hypothetical protein U9M48_039034 [Paspalum notatum var. saurae]|uniref:Neprosin activation peptide domain-containing protein n=1 Tax=Paspalum notatum var. saurae TaxID=547442 RepID=A0AAQ3XCP1_PASNO